MRLFHLASPLLLLLAPLILGAQVRDKRRLRQDIQAIADSTGARIGVAAMRLDEGYADSLQFAGSGHFPMQSVYKLPLALTVLDEIQKGKLSLTQTIIIQQTELDTATWSPMARAHKEEAFLQSIGQLVRLTVSQSDNNACDILFRLIGGPRRVQDYLTRIGIRDIRVVSTERQLHGQWALQYQNWSTPAAMLRLLELVEERKLLAPEFAAFLDVAMTATENSPKRIGGALPELRYVMAHKTGTSGTSSEGLTAAVNDVGILRYKGAKLALAVFVSDLRGAPEAGEQIIARISRLLWDFYMPE